MKNHLFTLLMLVTIGLSAQKLETKDLPAPVLNKFKAFYSTVEKADWEKNNKGYVAHFKDVDSRKVNVLFNADGSLIEKSWKSSKGDLTDAVNETVKKQFKDHKIEKVDKVEKGGFLFYEIQLSKKLNGVKTFYDTFFTDYGQLVSSEVKK